MPSQCNVIKLVWYGWMIHRSVSHFGTSPRVGRPSQAGGMSISGSPPPNGHAHDSDDESEQSASFDASDMTNVEKERNIVLQYLSHPNDKVLYYFSFSSFYCDDDDDNDMALT
jgi:hypothetical protein